MRIPRPALYLLLASFAGTLVCAVHAESPAAKPLLDMSPKSANLENRLVPQYGSESQVKAVRSQDLAAPGLLITVQPGKSGYPGIGIKPENGTAWDLSAYGHIEARVTNQGAKPATFAVRVDNPGDWHDSPWSSEQISLKPGETNTVTVIFGHSYGHKPSYALDPKKVCNILLFTSKADVPMTFRLESLVAAGPAGEKPAVDPHSVRIKPKSGVLFGPGEPIGTAKQIEMQGGADAADNSYTGGSALRVDLPAAQGEQAVIVKPPAGRWDLTRATQIRVTLKNEGAAPLAAKLVVTSNGGSADSSEPATVAAGGTSELVAEFAAHMPGRGVAVDKSGHFGTQNGTGTTFLSDAVSGVKIAVKHQGAGAMRIESIVAEAPPAKIPAWLGKRPPAGDSPALAGEWVKTFDEEFDAAAIDAAKWNIYGPNYWDHSSHWSKNNLLLADGVAKLHFEKKRGYHNDDPSGKKLQNLTGKNESDYACGYLDTIGKFRQCYGYFETRVKLPTAPGLWPTFWLMPDRGPDSGAKRSDTGSGGMEFDIMEHLTRWGQYRYNVALHWDGYGKEHKSVGSTTNYLQADKDGFITAGMLWTPGAVAFYGNGVEMWRWENPRVAAVPSYIIIEMTTGGWDNNAVDDKQLPADYLIDYVRVWQRKDLLKAARP